MDCEKCGAGVPEGARFCPTCGSAAGSATEPGGEAPTTAVPPVPPPGGTFPPPPGAPPWQRGPYRYVRNNPLCVAALILGIASLVMLWGPFFGPGIAGAGIVCAVIGIGQVDRDPEAYTGKNLGQAGLVLSIIGAVLSVIWHVFWWSRMWW